MGTDSGVGRAILAGILASAVLCVSPALPEEGNLPPSAPVPAGEERRPISAAVGEIRIRPENIFDLQDPRENNWLFRLANRLHYRTRPYVIGDQLLFRTGDRYDPRLLEESERNLRTNRYLYDARIRPVEVGDGRVDVEVVTRDVWTLRPGFSFKREGGRNTTSLDLEETNLFGRGSLLAISSDSTPDRDKKSARFANDHLFGGWFRTNLLFEENSDGRKRSFLLDRPFRALDARGAGGGTLTDDDRIDTLAGTGPTAGRYRVRERFAELYGGWSRGFHDGWTWRYRFGGRRDESRFSGPPEGTGGIPLPPNRVLAYPFLGIEGIQDEFDRTKNRDQIGRTEDFSFGLAVRASLGYATPAFGSDRRAFPFSASAGNGWRFEDDRWMFLCESAIDGRVEGGSARDTTISAAARAYLDLSPSWLVFASVSGARMIEPDDDRQLTLGGESGLRGYPLRYQGGDRKILVTIEQRYFSAWYPFRLFRVGGAAFLDAGRAWGGDRTGFPDPGILRDAGVGLRIGNTRSGLGNVIHVDLAFPFDGTPSIDRVQLHVVTKQSF